MRLITDLLQKNIEQIPDKTALVHGARRISYRELHAQVQQAANGLDALHGLPGNRVALLLPNCPEFVVTYFAAAASGNVAVPVNTLLQPAEIAYLLNNSQSSCLITTSELLPKVQAIREQVPALRKIVVVGAASGGDVLAWEEFLAEQPTTHTPARTLSPTDVMVFLYTSGTTGFPKGAMCSHANLLSNVATEAELYGMDRDDVFACILPLFHNYALVDTCLLPIWYGSTIILADLADTEELLSLIEKERITFLATMPAQLGEMVHRQGRRHDTSSLRMVQTGGAPLPTVVQHRFQALYGLPILEGYGCSEASSTVTVMPIHGPYKPLSVGKVMPNQRLRIVDDEGRDVRDGQEGEIIVRGPNVCRGYYGLPAESREALRDGWLHTGDLGRLDDEGFLYITGRKKSMINVGGFKVYPAEVEEVLCKADGVVEACVVAAFDPTLGEVCKAFVTTSTAIHQDEARLLRHCAQCLGAYKVPRAIEFRAQLPRTGTGKISAKELQAEELNRVRSSKHTAA